jgi:hypothetical protein
MDRRALVIGRREGRCLAVPGRAAKPPLQRQFLTVNPPASGVLREEAPTKIP